MLERDTRTLKYRRRFSKRNETLTWLCLVIGGNRQNIRKGAEWLFSSGFEQQSRRAVRHHAANSWSYGPQIVWGHYNSISLRTPIYTWTKNTRSSWPTAVTSAESTSQLMKSVGPLIAASYHRLRNPHHLHFSSDLMHARSWRVHSFRWIVQSSAFQTFHTVFQLQIFGPSSIMTIIIASAQAYPVQLSTCNVIVAYLAAKATVYSTME